MMTCGRRHADRRSGFQPDGGRPAPDAHEVGQARAAAVRDAVLAVAREDEVVGAQRAGRADLRGLLAEQRRPQPELALALQRGRLGVDAAHDDHVLVEGQQLLGADVGDQGVEARIRHARAVRRQKLDKVETEQLGLQVFLGCGGAQHSSPSIAAAPVGKPGTARSVTAPVGTPAAGPSLVAQS